MDIEQIEFVFSLFSLIGLIGILVYLIFDKANADEKSDRIEILELKIDSLQGYVYELDEHVEKLKESKAEENIKEKIIEMYRDGKEPMVIENALNIPKAKIEMVIKFHELKEKKQK